MGTFELIEARLLFEGEAAAQAATAVDAEMLATLEEALTVMAASIRSRVSPFILDEWLMTRETVRIDTSRLRRHVGNGYPISVGAGRRFLYGLTMRDGCFGIKLRWNGFCVARDYERVKRGGDLRQEEPADDGDGRCDDKGYALR